MRRKIIISALIVAILLIASCVYFSNPPSVARPAITSDNSGGAIVIYEVYKIFHKCDCYVQRIGPEGDFLWGEKGILIGSGYKALGLYSLHAVSDGSGGAIVIWRESLPRPKGKPPYPRYLSKTYVLKVDSEGNFPWGKDGVSLGLHGHPPCRDAASDNLGGVIGVQKIAKEDSISAQRVDSEGNILWQRGGVQAFVGPAEEPQVTSDGSGGAIIAYRRMIPSEEHKHGYSDSDIYAQRIDAKGNILWGPDGVPICVGPSHPDSPRIVDDGAGGAIIIWREIHLRSENRF